MAKAALLMLGAAFVCSAIVVSLVVLGVAMVYLGQPIGVGDVVGSLVFGGLSLLVLALTLNATRFSAETGWRFFRAMFITLVIAGGGFGVWFGRRVAQEKEELAASSARELCRTLLEVRGSAPSDCEARARSCYFEGLEHPIRARRGMADGDHDRDTRIPSSGAMGAAYRCLAE